MREIGEEFNGLREKNRTLAWQTVQRRLMENADALVPEIFQPKDFFTMCMDIEQYVKTDSGSHEGSAIEQVQKFLSGENETDRKPGRTIN